MKLSISEVRKRLPELVCQVRKHNGAKVEITVYDEVVAELRGTMPAPQPGAAASKLLSLMRKLPKCRGRRTNVSNCVNEYLYGTAGTKR
jgi:antitoxin (DNA-binding transcriptional repressor) of toxin-antitoxin stability system